MQHLSKDFDSFGSTLLSEIAGTVAGSCGQIERKSGNRTEIYSGMY
jgi:hypothetical protein